MESREKGLVLSDLEKGPDFDILGTSLDVGLGTSFDFDVLGTGFDFGALQTVLVRSI